MAQSFPLKIRQSYDLDGGINITVVYNNLTERRFNIWGSNLSRALTSSQCSAKDWGIFQSVKRNGYHLEFTRGNITQSVLMYPGEFPTDLLLNQEEIRILQLRLKAVAEAFAAPTDELKEFDLWQT